MKQRIYFNEVVTHDGFQMEPEFVPADTKVELIDAMCRFQKNLEFH
jgi:hydroxymethylglutaryl-CoA lyase